MEKRLGMIAIIFAILGSNVASGEEEMPIMAKPGQCFTKSFYPPKYTKTVKTTSTKRVKLSESTVKYKVIPPVYSWHEERVKISDGTEKIVTSPAVYKTVYERILLEPSKKSWRKNVGAHSQKAFNSCVQAAEKSGMNIQNVEVGTCYYEHFQPAKYETVTEKLLAAEASQRIEAIPAQYRTITKKITTSNSTMKLIPVPIKYKKVQEKVVVAPARSEWKKTTCNNRGCNQSEVVCLVEVPRTYKTVTKKVILKPAIAKKVAVEPVYKYVKAQELVSPATSKVIPIPAKYTTINRIKKISDAKYTWSDVSARNESSRIHTECDKICLVETAAKYKKVARKVVVTPAISKKLKTPAKYTMVKVRKVEKEASFDTITVPAEYIEVKVERERTKGYSKWMPMVCESNMTPSLVKKVQQALKFQGFYRGSIDGIWNFEAKNAVRAYQKANGLAVTKLSIETMKSLGID